MKKILFIIPSFRIGGTMTSLKNLLPLINNPEYKLFVYPITNEGPNKADIERFATIIGSVSGRRETTYSPRQLLSTVLSKSARTVKRALVNLGIDISPILFRTAAHRLKGFDVVIAFQEGHPALFASFVEAPIKVAWLHSMFKVYLQSRKSKDKEIRLYNSFDRIVCVSKTAAQDLLDCSESFRGKVNVVYNAINPNLVLELAKKDVSLGTGFNCVSVGRIDTVKRFSYIPIIASKLINKGLRFDWWIVGGVADKREYQKLIDNIKEYGCGDCIHLMGQQDNPYPYIDKSDVLVCLSSSETFNYTIAEAKVLGVPVITTDFPSSFEFVTDGFNGCIAPIEDIASKIETLYSDKKLYAQIKENVTKEYDISTSTIDGFDKLMNGLLSNG